MQYLLIEVRQLDGQRPNQKKPPLREADPEAFATGPSSASEIPVKTRRINPKRKDPKATKIEAATAKHMPAIVTRSAVTPALCRPRPIGLKPLSTTFRQFPSSITFPNLQDLLLHYFPKPNRLLHPQEKGLDGREVNRWSIEEYAMLVGF